MAKKKRNLKRKIRIKESAKLVHKNDKTSVKRPNMQDTIPIVEGRPPANNAATFRVKIRKK